MDGLTNGRIVHVNDAVAKCQAGIVTKVHSDDGLINAGGYREGGTPVQGGFTSVPHDESQELQYSWHWPERA